MQVDLEVLNGGVVVVTDGHVLVTKGERKFELKGDSGGADWSLPYIVAEEL